MLAVDDERPALDDLARVLRGHEGVDRVECAASGQEALQALATTAYDAVFLDVRMPGLDGVELARVLRRFASPPALVFVSAYESAAVEAFELRAVDYLLKPVSRARLDEALDRVRGREPADARRARPTGRRCVAVDARAAAARASCRARRSSTCRPTATTCASSPPTAAT